MILLTDNRLLLFWIVFPLFAITKPIADLAADLQREQGWKLPDAVRFIPMHLRTAQDDTPSTLLLFLPDDLKLCEGFKVLRTASRTLGPNKGWQVETATADAKDLHFDGVLQQFLIATPTCHLPKEIKGTLVSSVKFSRMPRVATDH